MNSSRGNMDSEHSSDSILIVEEITSDAELTEPTYGPSSPISPRTISPEPTKKTHIDNEPHTRQLKEIRAEVTGQQLKRPNNNTDQVPSKISRSDDSLEALVYPTPVPAAELVPSLLPTTMPSIDFFTNSKMTPTSIPSATFFKDHRCINHLGEGTHPETHPDHSPSIQQLNQDNQPLTTPNKIYWENQNYQEPTASTGTPSLNHQSMHDHTLPAGGYRHSNYLSSNYSHQLNQQSVPPSC